MDKSLLAIREYFKNNNPGNVKLPFNQDGLSKKDIIRKANELGYKEGKDYYMGDFAYRKYSNPNKGIIEMIEQAERYKTNNLNEIIENYARPEIVEGQKRFPTKYNTYKEKFKKYGLDQDTIDFSNKEQVIAFTKAFVEVENQVKKDGSPTNWEKYYTDDVINTAVNEYVTFKNSKKDDLQTLSKPKIDVSFGNDEVSKSQLYARRAGIY
jgi:hypothetical protein